MVAHRKRGRIYGRSERSNHSCRAYREDGESDQAAAVRRAPADSSPARDPGQGKGTPERPARWLRHRRTSADDQRYRIASLQLLAAIVAGEPAFRAVAPMLHFAIGDG